MNRFRSNFEQIPRWGWITAIYCFALQCLFYFSTSFIIKKTGTSAHAIIPKIPVIDDRIPLIPAFVLIYWYSWPFWFCGTLRMSLTDKKNFINWLIAFTIAYFIGFLSFCLVPTYVDRYIEGLFAVATRNGFFNRMLWITYTFDSGRIAFNCCPSYHCLYSMMLFMGVRKQEGIPKGFRIYTLIVATLIFMSTVLTKQHYIVDVFGGVGLAVICTLLVEKWNPSKYFPNLLSKLEEADSKRMSGISKKTGLLR